jgi:hypothetical protein
VDGLVVSEGGDGGASAGEGCEVVGFGLDVPLGFAEDRIRT